jgi:hypothetical protein
MKLIIFFLPRTWILHKRTRGPEGTRDGGSGWTRLSQRTTRVAQDRRPFGERDAAL